MLKQLFVFFTIMGIIFLWAWANAPLKNALFLTLVLIVVFALYLISNNAKIGPKGFYVPDENENENEKEIPFN